MTYKITILGCGDSAGVPRVGGDWGVCNPDNPKNRRTRPSIMIQSATTTIVVDTGPDFAHQLTQMGIQKIDAVLYTHDHSDHIMGMDELRIIQGRGQQKIPIYADAVTMQSLSRKFDYLFNQISPYYPSVVEPRLFTDEDWGRVVKVGDIPVIPFLQDHGQGNNSLGFRVGDVAYSTDMRDLPASSIATLQGIKTWIADCADYSHGHGTLHAQFPTIQKLADAIKPAQTYLTHLKMFCDYDVLASSLPDGFAPCYDGLVIESC